MGLRKFLVCCFMCGIAAAGCVPIQTGEVAETDSDRPTNSTIDPDLIRDLVPKSVLIFEGVMRRIETYRKDNLDNIYSVDSWKKQWVRNRYTDHVFEVTKILKGNEESKTIRITQSGGGDASGFISSRHFFTLSLDQTYIVFAIVPETYLSWKPYMAQRTPKIPNGWSIFVKYEIGGEQRVKRGSTPVAPGGFLQESDVVDEGMAYQSFIQLIEETNK